ncbi:MAG TPA: cytochrome c [Chitinophagaceae bacterium]|nr:cytochrome c [Chitinophagaceae bacterium]
MNRQISYITTAHLILAAIATGYFIFSTISTTKEQGTGSLPIDNEPNSTAPMSQRAAYGKTLFLSKCASCHNIFRDATGPPFLNMIENPQWSDRQQLYKWIRNPEEFMKTNAYTRELKKTYGAMMMSFPDITDDEIDAIVEYVNSIAVK